MKRKDEVPTLGTIKIDKLRWLLGKLEKDYGSNQKFLNELDLTFEFVVGSLFPMAVHNMKNNLNQEHTKGYIEGYNDGLESRKKKIKK